MKFFVAFLFLAVFTGFSTAEPPSRFRTRFLARQEAAPEAEATTPAAEPEAEAPAQSGPYPPSGWKPSGRAFELPTEKANPPATSYGTPSTVYGAPAPSAPSAPSATDAEASTEPESEAVQPEEAAPDASGRLKQRPQKLTAAPVQQGDFYLLVPGGGLQRLQLVPAQNSKFAARLTQAPQPVFILNP